MLPIKCHVCYSTEEKSNNERRTNMSNFHRYARTRCLVLIFCLVYILSACALLPNNSPANLTPTPTAKRPLPVDVSPLPTSTPLSDSQLATHIVYNMTLDQKLGQMVIVEFYGATLSSDLKQMLQGNQVSGV